MKALALVLVGLVASGCQSRSVGVCVSPRVTGRVLDAGTSQPLAGVVIRRGNPDRPGSAPPKGGELLMCKPAVQTGLDGSFVLEQEQMLNVLPRSGWTSLRLSFEHSGYHRFVTNVSSFNLPTNAPATTVNAGDILLRPVRP